MINLTLRCLSYLNVAFNDECLGNLEWRFLNIIFWDFLLIIFPLHQFSFPIVDQSYIFSRFDLIEKERFTVCQIFLLSKMTFLFINYCKKLVFFFKDKQKSSMDLFKKRDICMRTLDNIINTLLFPRMYFFFLQSYIFIYIRRNILELLLIFEFFF